MTRQVHPGSTIGVRGSTRSSTAPLAPHFSIPKHAGAHNAPLPRPAPTARSRACRLRPAVPAHQPACRCATASRADKLEKLKGVGAARTCCRRASRLCSWSCSSASAWVSSTRLSTVAGLRGSCGTKYQEYKESSVSKYQGGTMRMPQAHRDHGCSGLQGFLQSRCCAAPGRQQP